MMAEDRNPILMGMLPDVEDCSTDLIPVDVLKDPGKRTIEVPVLETMTKFLYSNYRLSMYTFVNQLLWRGKLSGIVGVKPLNRVFNGKTMRLPDKVDFWRIDRESFFADVPVVLSLETATGTVEWKGYLVFWFSFKEKQDHCIEELTDLVDREGLIKLDSCLVPVATNKQMDELAEDLWRRYIPEALTNKDARNAKALAEKLGLRIQYEDVYEHKNSADSILFFAEGDLVTGKDRVVKDEKGEKHVEKEKNPRIIRIPANTIVINTNRVKVDYSAFNIYHECIHYVYHYLFFRIQELASNDPRKVKTEKVVIDKDAEYKDPIYFMEKQANRGAYGLLLPATDTQNRILTEKSMVEDAAHVGEIYEVVGIRMSEDYHLPRFRIRPRMIQLGHFEAKGALNYIDGHSIPPFAFEDEALREEGLTLVLRYRDMMKLRGQEPMLDRLLNTRKYIYADGHIVRNDYRFVEKCYGVDKLTPWANAHADKCCLRFIKKYVQESVGNYVFGRMYLDTDYIERTEVFLKKTMEENGVDELDAETMFLSALPKNFKLMIDDLRKPERVSIAKLAEMMNMNDDTFTRWLEDPRFYRNEDFLTMLCLSLKLPDWLSRHVFRRGGMQLDEREIKRHRVIGRILRVQPCEGIEEANKMLIRYEEAPLALGVEH